MSVTTDRNTQKKAELSLVVALVIAFCVSLFIGRLNIPITNGISGLLAYLGHRPTSNFSYADWVVMFQIRLPRIILAVAVGASLSTAGASYQCMFRNPIVDPFILGVSSGAAFGACLVLLMPTSPLGLVQVAAFLSGIGAITITLTISKVAGGSSTFGLILCGVAVSAFFSALISIEEWMANPYTQLPSLVFWQMGGLWATTWSSTISVLPIIIPGIIVLQLLRWRLNVLSLGDSEAKSLGMNVSRLKLIIIVCATLVTAAAVSVTGIIGWIGLVVPHMMRFVVGPDHRYLLPASTIMGGIFLLICDDIARSLFTSEIPIGVVTAILGIPVFAILLRRGLRRGIWQS